MYWTIFMAQFWSVKNEKYGTNDKKACIKKAPFWHITLLYVDVLIFFPS